MTDEQIDAIANTMPGGMDGFLKGWGWRQFASAVLNAANKDYEGQQERCQFLVSVCRDAQEMASTYGGALHVIATFPMPEQDGMHGANMREIAANTLRRSVS